MLDLEANRISEFSQISALEQNPNLKHLTLKLNPVSHEKSFQKRVTRILSNLLTLDDLHVKAI